MAASFVFSAAGDPNAWLDACTAALLGMREGDGAAEERALLLYLLGDVLLEGRLEEADRLFAHEELFLETGRAAALPYTLYVRGMLRKLQGKPDLALKDFRRAEELPDPYGLLGPLVRVETAGAYLELGLADRAWRELGEAQDLDAELQRARIELYSGRPKALLNRVEKVLPKVAADDQASLREQFRLQQAIALAETGAVERARPMLIELMGSQRLNPVERTEARLHSAMLELRLGNAAAARERLESSDTRHRTAMQCVRWAAARAQCARLLNSPREELLQRRSELERTQEDFFQLWSQAPLLDSGVAFLQYEIRRTSLGERIALDLHLDGAKLGAERGLSLVLRAQALGTFARQKALPVPTLADLRSELMPSDGGILILLPSPFESHLFAVDARELSCHKLPPSVRLEKALEGYARAIVQPPQADSTGEWSRASAALVAEWLPPEVLARIKPWKSLITMGFDSFGFAPLEALQVPGIGVLGDHKVLSSLPSVPVGIWLRRHSKGQSSGVRRMLLAPKIPKALAERWPGLQPIPWGADQTRELLGVLGSAKWELLVDAQATRERFLAPCAELVLLTHGVQDLERDRPAGLVLAGSEEPLYAEDMRGWSSAPELAVLACCGAGRGVVRRGDEGLNHLGGALHIAGVPTVIFSAADLDYDSTRALLMEFLRARSNGAHTGEALRLARAALAREERWAHPYYRSLLVISGLASRN